MSGIETEAKTTVKDELYTQYNWFYSSFLPQLQNATNEFFSDMFSLKLVSVSRNINLLFQGDDYFVTKIRMDKEHEIFVRCSSDAIKIILDNVLGKNEKFDLAKITGLEAKIISSFNDYLYNSISKFFVIPAPKGTDTKPIKRKNFDTVHLTFFIKDHHLENGAKLIISIPQDLLASRLIRPARKQIDISKYKTSMVKVNIKIGKTKFSLKELKNLEKEDIVIFEDSNIHKMKLIFDGCEKVFKVSPNLNLITSTNNDNTNNGGPNMETDSFPQNVWDNIQIDMGAEFEKVKISLGELKNIEQGLVVDIGSVYNNRVSLKVENKTIAEGELIIINDRYGVRVDKVINNEKTNAMENKETNQPTEEGAEAGDIEEETLPQSEDETDEAKSDEEFDYSDFELDDEDI